MSSESPAGITREGMLARRFLSLPDRKQVMVLTVFDVLTESDWNCSWETQTHLAFKRISDKGLTWKLWEEIEKHCPDPAPVNPWKET